MSPPLELVTVYPSVAHQQLNSSFHTLGDETVPRNDDDPT